MTPETLLDRIWTALNTPLLGTPFTLTRIIIVLAALAALTWLTGVVSRWILRTLRRRSVDEGVVDAFVHIGRYLFLAIGTLVILQSAGIDLSALTVLLGALGVGLGFGLQNVTSNFVSGLIILIERPIKIGDRVEVGDLTGTVRHVGARATTIVTNDEIAIIVPNSEFISSRVTNWSYTGRTVRFHVPVGVAYGSDVERVREVLLDVARRHRGVVSDPKPDVIFHGFGDSSLDFELRVWTMDYIHVPLIFRSELNFAVWHALKEAGVEIPFPQRDLHVRSGALTVRVEDRGTDVPAS